MNKVSGKIILFYKGSEVVSYFFHDKKQRVEIMKKWKNMYGIASVRGFYFVIKGLVTPLSKGEKILTNKLDDL